MTPEGKVKAECKKVLDALKPDCWYFMPVSSGMGTHGIADFVGCYKGMMFAIEAKAVGKGRPTTLQKLTMDKIDSAGGLTMVVGGADGFDVGRLRWLITGEGV